MRCLGFVLTVVLLVGCEAVDTHTIAKGPIWLVTREDIRAAIAAARAGEESLRTAVIHEVVIDSRDEIHVVIGYTGPEGSERWAIVRRIHGTWRYVTSEGMVVTS